MAENELKFKKLSDVELIEEAPDSAHALAEIDGEIKRVAGGLGGGAGGYLVDATGDGEFMFEGDVVAITTPVPGIMEAAEKGSVVTVKFDIASFEVFGNCLCYMTCTGIANYYDAMVAIGVDASEVHDALKDAYISGAEFAGDFVQIVFLNGHTMDEFASTASLSTLSTPAALNLTNLKGGKAVAE